MSLRRRFRLPPLAAVIVAALTTLPFGAPVRATVSRCDTSPTPGQTVVCGFADASAVTIAVPRIGYWAATHVTVRLLGGGGGGGGGHGDEAFDESGARGGDGAIVAASLSLPTQALSVTVALGAPGIGGTSTPGSDGTSGTDGGDSQLSLTTVSTTDVLLIAEGGGGGEGHVHGSSGPLNGESGGAYCDSDAETDGIINECTPIGNAGNAGEQGGPGSNGQNGGAGLVAITFMFGPTCSDYLLDDVFVGSGTANDPFLIDSETDLLRMSGCTFEGKYLKQTEDVITTTDPVPVKDGGLSFLSYELGPSPFQGTYDGNGGTIAFDLRSSSCSTTQPLVGCGVFAQTAGAVIENLHIDAGNAGGSGVPGVTRYLGGWLTNTDNEVGDRSSRFSGISATGDIGSGAGGLVGSANGTRIYDSSMTGAMRENNGGGIVGQYANEVIIERSSSHIDPLDALFGGGIVGPYADATLTNVFATGPVSRAGGGIAGAFARHVTISNCFTTGEIRPFDEDENVVFSDTFQSGGILGTDPGYGTIDNPNTIRNCFSTGEIKGWSGGIVGRTLGDNPNDPNDTQSRVTVENSYSAGRTARAIQRYWGRIFASSSLINNPSGSDIRGYYNESEFDLGSAAFQLDRFAGSVGASSGAWNDGAYSGAVWALCALVDPNLPYLTAFYAVDPCAPPPPQTTTTSPSNSAPNLNTVLALPTPTVPLIADTTLVPGAPVTLTFDGFVPGEFVQLIVASTPRVIASGASDASGSITLSGVIPDSLELGEHSLALWAPVSGRGIRQPITIVARVSELPQTGSTGGEPFMLGILLLVIGSTVRLVRRRRTAS